MRLLAPFFVAAMFCCGAFAQSSAVEQDSSEPDSQIIQDFRVIVRGALLSDNYQQLETLAASLASSKARFPGGTWKLRAFYLNVQGPGALTASDARWTAHIARLERWAAAMPNSAVPRIALANAWHRYAWKARGNGWASSVTPEGRAAYQERIQKARAVLEEAQSMANRDPQWFVTMQFVALDQGWPQAEESTLEEMAAAAAPDYWYIYARHVDYLLPKWYGKPGDAAAFLNNAANQIGGKEGDFVYFAVASMYNCCRAQPEISELSWDRIKSGFAAADELYTTTNSQRNRIAFMALAAGDKQFAQQMFARIGDDWDQEVWRGKPMFENAKANLTLPWQTAKSAAVN